MSCELPPGAQGEAGSAVPSDGTETASHQLAKLTAPTVSSKENQMSDMARKHPSFPELVAPLDEEGSVIRARDAGDVRPPQGSSAKVPETTGTASSRVPTNVRPAGGSLGERLDQKLRLASVLMRDLPPTDTRVRLLNIAIMRRDEALLDGVLAELNKPTTRS
jgi:hypothetical protein